MKRKFTLLLIICLLPVVVWAQVDVGKAFTHAQTQTERLLQEITQAQTPERPDLLLPRTLTTTGALKLVPTKDWTSGFFPGNLWFLYEYTRNANWRTQAQAFTAKLAPEQFDRSTHDVGFKIYNSYGAGYRLTQNAAYRDVIIQAAKSLSTRFNAKIGCLKSWDHSSQWTYPVIIDNMMNLELLFAATRLTGDSSYYKIAVTHANTTLKNHFRPDFSSWHVVDYDPNTGKVLQKTTAQGYNNSSAWARGQAWGLYGFTLCYRETKNRDYLTHAEKIAAFILNHPNLPADLVPYWDFDAPLIPNEPRDVSAAAIIASALYELSTYSSQGTVYRAAADKIVNRLATSYISPVGQSRGFILLHSTGHKPGNSEIDVPLIYADYYYLEALLRKNQINSPPVLNAIANKSVTAGQTLNFTATATDANTGQTKTYSLVNAPAGATIQATTGAFSWKPAQAGTYKFFVKVTDNGSPILTDEEPVTITVTPTASTYTLQVAVTGNGTVSKNPNQASYPAGTTVTLTAAPAAGYQFSGWSGAATGTTNPLSITINNNITITATFRVATGQQVTQLNLIRADTDQLLQSLTEGAVLNLATLPTPNLNIQAITNPVAVGSVVFSLTGSQTRNQTETTTPYALFGDVNGNFNNWTPAVGNYTLKATPYTAASGGGTAGTPFTINFSVVNQSTTPYTLTVGAVNGTVSKNPNQTNYAAGTNVTLTAMANSGYQFTGWSGDVTGTTNPLTVAMTSNKNITANFTPVTGQQVVSFTLINATTDQPIRTMTPGEVINLAAGNNLNIRVNTNPATVGSVKMTLKLSNGTVVKNTTETGMPYALFGDVNGNFNNWTPAVGSYTLTATPYTAASGGGTAGTPLTLNFSVENRTTAHAFSLTAYPTPTSNGHIQVKLDTVWEGSIMYQLISEAGALLTAGELILTEPTATLEFNFSQQMLTSGLYYLYLKGRKQKVALTLMQQ